MRAWRSRLPLAAVDIHIFLAPSKLPPGDGSSQLCLSPLPGKSERSFCQANSKEWSDEFLFAHIFIYYFFPPSFSEKLLETFLKGLFSATSFLLHHCEHCNIIKLVKRKQWCLSFSQTARCSF